MDIWNCGVLADGYTDSRYTHLELFGPELFWTKDEWETIKNNMLMNIALMGQDNPNRDGILKHFSKKYIEILSNMLRFLKRIQKVEGYDISEVAAQAERLVHELRGGNNVIEMISSDDYNTVVEGSWYLRDRFVEEGLDNCHEELMLLINRVMLQKPVALEQCMNLLAEIVEYKPEEMATVFGGALLEVLKKYALDFDYETLFVRVPAMYKWLRTIAKEVESLFGDEPVVKYWLGDSSVNRFSFVD